MVFALLYNLNGGMKKPQPQAKKRQFRRTYIREWRKFRDMTLEELAGRLEMTASHFSMLERGQRGYTQETLESVAEALKTTTSALLMRNPERDGDWSVWDQAEPGERRLAIELLKTIKNTAT